ncbi:MULTISPECIES: cytochrome P450 [unclassified Amycolatopsis]|uniref:cytochrome P450 n=1 Tax=unclassified Amycolatopsis TaxID=2618356 RepID=UPI0028750BC6|nr:MULTISPECIES: cytochrome P450 [unclassified Amycolatopsis]MDS0136033.1 cytochrome P450 [Amycolatopsis sp. 505]MDS0145378.1 cytochrome P450 [Amycolatopsis sp. CM201R]
MTAHGLPPLFPFDEPPSTDPAAEALRLLHTDPVPLVRLAGGHRVRLVTRYDDVQRTMSDPRMSRAALATPDAPTIVPGLQSPDMMPNMDPPDHTRLRRLVAKAFTVRNVELLRPRVEEVAAGLVDRMLAAGPPADLVGALAEPLPGIVICELLGIARDEREPLLAFIEAMSITTTFDQEEFGATGAVAPSHLLGLIEQKRHHPGDDLLSGLTQVHDEDGDRLSEAELLITVMLLIGAGQETTMAQLAKSVLLLSRHPDQWARLVAEPDLVPNAVEELLRVVALGHAGQPRMAREAVDFSGRTVEAGTTVFPVVNAANRDPAVFADPDRFDVARGEAAHHLSFGRGPHFCLGAPLARMELQVALRGLVTRMPGLRVAEGDDELAWQPESLTRGLRRLLITW